MQSSVLFIALVGFLACVNTVSGIDCYMCNFADTDDPTIIAALQSTKDCQKDPPSKYLQKIPSQPTKNSASKVAESSSMGLAINGFGGQLVNQTAKAVGTPRVDYDIYCMTATGKFLGVPVIVRGAAYFQDGKFEDKDGKCDNGKDLGLEQLLTGPQACYCDDNGCNDGRSGGGNGGSLAQISSLSFVLSIIATVLFSRN